MKDIYHDLLGKLGLAHAAYSKAGGAQTGAAIDLQGYEAALIVCSSGALGTQVNTYTFSLTESDNNSDYSSVGAADIIGTASVFTYSSSPAVDESSTVKTFGYIGNKRYIKVTATPAGSGTGSGVVGANVILGKPRRAPVV